MNLALAKEVVASSKRIVDAVSESQEAFEANRTEAGYAAIATVIEEIERLRGKLPA